MKTIIVITGAPGTGKTETAKKLMSLCPERSVWIDTDKLVGIQPFTIDQSFYDLLYSNLSACLYNFAKWEASVIVISGVILPIGIYNPLSKFQLPGYEWHYYGLIASKAAILQRIASDNKGQDGVQRKSWLHISKQVHEIKDCHVINNSHKSIEQVVNIIARREQMIIKTASVRRQKINIRVPYSKVSETLIHTLQKHKVNELIATKIAKELIQNECDGYSSHGLLRLPEYINDLHTGAIQQNALPSIKSLSKQVSIVNGNRSWGFLAAEKVAVALESALQKNQIVAVSLINSHHIGRLSSIARPLVEKGYIILGFVNYLGAGQKVPVYGGKEGRFCTNPMLIGIPTGDRAPVILDMTTSSVAEGRVREYALSQETLPEGWLIDKNWQIITDAVKLYTSPPAAMISPLGGQQAYKGVGLSFCTEILAGIITNAGFVQPGYNAGGNGGLFIGLHPEIFGVSLQELYKNMGLLIEYCRQSEIVEGFEPFRYPGESSIKQPPEWLNIKTTTWEEIQKL